MIRQVGAIVLVIWLVAIAVCIALLPVLAFVALLGWLT